MERVSVVGSSGSGKTTMARELADVLESPYLELDSVFHQPDWTPLPDSEFRSEVDEFTSQGRWVVDGNYSSHGVLDLVWGRSDSVVWLDPPKTVVMSRVIRRTVRRAITREELWNGNREPMSNFTKWDPEENVIRWSWTRFDHTRSKYEARAADSRWSHLTITRVRSRKDADLFLKRLV
jgi:adenylate kinase family enzyme